MISTYFQFETIFDAIAENSRCSGHGGTKATGMYCMYCMYVPAGNDLPYHLIDGFIDLIDLITIPSFPHLMPVRT